MFFAKFAAGHPADECPDNDQHNVDAADSIVATIPVALTAHEDAAAALQVLAHLVLARLVLAHLVLARLVLAHLVLAHLVPPILWLAGRWLLLWPSRGSHRNRNNLLHCSLPLCVTSCAEPLSELPLLRLAKLLVLT